VTAGGTLDTNLDAELDRRLEALLGDATPAGPDPRRPSARLAGRRRLPHHRRVMSLCRNARFTGDRVSVLEARVRT
jgi:hypothetical protein